jgi:hypothetical protein
VAVFAGVVEGEADVFFDAEYGLLELNGEANLQIAATGRTALATPAEGRAGAAHELVEDVREVEAFEALSAAAAEGAALAAAGKRVALGTGVAKLVVTGALLRVFERLVGLPELLELGIVAAVAVGVVFHGELTVGTLNLIRAGGLAHS